MKYIQAYKSKQMTDLGMHLETIDSKSILLTNQEITIYNCFATAMDIETAFTMLYGDVSTHLDHIESFNTLLVTWIQLGILKSI